MRSFVAASSVVVLAALASSAVAQTPKEIVEKAIAAQGGLDNLKKYPGGKETSKGKIFIGAVEATVEGEQTYLMPDMLKIVTKMEVGGMKVTIDQIFNAGQFKMTASIPTPPLSDAAKKEIKNTMNLHIASELYPLLDDKRFEMSVIDKPEKVKDKEVVGLLIKVKGESDLKFFFDAKTFVMVKIERKGLDFAEQEVNQEMLILDHKKFDGILRVAKYEMLFDGKKAAEMEVTGYKHLDKVDKKLFDISD